MRILLARPQVALANAINASMWVSLPRAANDTDAYIRGMVTHIATNLAPALGLTLEYGTDGPGWMSSHLPTSTRLISSVARRAWADAGRPREQLRVIQAAPSAQ